MPKAIEKVLHVNINADLRNAFTGLCRMRGERVKDVLTRLLAAWVYNERKEQGPK